MKISFKGFIDEIKKSIDAFEEERLFYNGVERLQVTEPSSRRIMAVRIYK